MKEEIRLLIQAPGRQPIEHTFDQTEKIVQVIEWAAHYLGIPMSPNLILDYDGETLKDDRTIESYHIGQGQTLILSDNSGGV